MVVVGDTAIVVANSTRLGTRTILALIMNCLALAPLFAQTQALIQRYAAVFFGMKRVNKMVNWTIFYEVLMPMT